MPAFICALSTRKRTPTAYALLEQKREEGVEAPVYAVRELGRFDDGNPADLIRELTASDSEMVGKVTVVATGGRTAASELRKAGLTVVPVDTQPAGTREADVVRVGEQTLVDTFEAVYRDSAVDADPSDRLFSDALAALYTAMSDDAGADDLDEDFIDDGDLDLARQPAPTTIYQTGRSSNVSTANVGGDDHAQDMRPMAKGEVEPRRRGRVDDADSGFDPVELGEQRDVALALALGIWYGEYSAEEIPTTDQAADTRRVRGLRRERQRRARRAQR